MRTKTKKTGLRSALNAIGCTLTILIALLLVFVIICNMMGTPPFVAGHTLMRVRTDSMEPLIPTNGYILVKRTSADEINVDDVIVFYSDDPRIAGSLNTHRVVSIVGANEEFVTKGDHNPINDDTTAKAGKIVGRYVKTLPFLSAVNRLLSTKGGMIAAVAILFAILLLTYLPDLIRSAQSKEKADAAAHEAELNERVKAEVERLKAENSSSENNAPDPSLHFHND